MDSKAGDLWSEIIASEEEDGSKLKLEAVYQRRRPRNNPKDVESTQFNSIKEIRVSLAPAGKRISWNRSLSMRGRTSIAVGAFADIRPQPKQSKRRARPGLPKPRKVVQPPNMEKEKDYFNEVDAFELLEESPSPKNVGKWVVDDQIDNVEMPRLSSRLEKWLISKKLDYSCGPSSTLSKILETPAIPLEPNSSGNDSSSLKTPENSSLKNASVLQSVRSSTSESLINRNVLHRDTLSEHIGTMSSSGEQHEDIEAAIKKLSLTSTLSSLEFDHVDSFAELLSVCGQSAPSNLLNVFSKFCDPQSIVKLGEGTYGEAFRAGDCVCKIVPIDGDFRVNGEIQKRSEELLEEVILSRTLNQLRVYGDDACNSCPTFIETLDLKVCKGHYDASLIRAWEEWDEKHGSENDHPKEFPENQCYVVFVLQHGGKDLESFVLLSFDEARSLLFQVIVGLAVAEAAYEFEHRDLHWGNILLRRNDSDMLKFSLEGKQMLVRTYGLDISIIDFTLSRMNTGEKILFLDLSVDPDLFKGPKGDKQSETYRKMKEVTEDNWEASFPRTNVLWIIYLIDILIMKKTFERSSKDIRNLRSLKKSLDEYSSAKEAVFDPFFSDMLVDHPAL